MIKMISGSTYVDGRLRTAKDPFPFSADEATEARLVKLGVAAWVVSGDFEPVATSTGGENVTESGTDTSEAKNGAEGAEAAHLDPAQLEAMTKAKLLELAEAMEIDVTGLKTKAELIGAICAVEIIPGNELESDSDSEEPPAISAEAPMT